MDEQVDWKRSGGRVRTNAEALVKDDCFWGLVSGSVDDVWHRRVRRWVEGVIRMQAGDVLWHQTVPW